MILNQTIQHTYIICNKEDVTKLETALRAEGLDNISRVTREYSEQEKTYARQSRCLIAHHDAWQECKKHEGLSLIVEADFVPAVGFGEQVIPFSKEKIGSAWGWLYSCAQRAYEFDGDFIRGHSATMVAYVIDANAASKVEGFVDYEFSRNPPQTYAPWDTYIRMYAQQHGVAMYLPFRSYGEHGGIANREHKGRIKNPNHQADILINRLHFLPIYARGSLLRYRKFRFLAYTRAWLRLLSFRYIETAILKSSAFGIRYKLRFCLMATRRLLPFSGRTV